MPAPEGVRHGKAVHPFELIERIRDEYEYQGKKPSQIYREYAHIPRDTLRDWIFYRGRLRS